VLQIPQEEKYLEVIVTLWEKVTLFTGEMATKCCERRLALTGNYDLYLVPGTAKTGDFVAIVQNCRVPFALRNVGANYQLVGDCHVHGMAEHKWELVIVALARDEEEDGDINPRN
jgi:hypothetical protein